MAGTHSRFRGRATEISVLTDATCPLNPVGKYRPQVGARVRARLEVSFTSAESADRCPIRSLPRVLLHWLRTWKCVRWYVATPISESPSHESLVSLRGTCVWFHDSSSGPLFLDETYPTSGARLRNPLQRSGEASNPATRDGGAGPSGVPSQSCRFRMLCRWAGTVEFSVRLSGHL